MAILLPQQILSKALFEFLRACPLGQRARNSPLPSPELGGPFNQRWVGFFFDPKDREKSLDFFSSKYLVRAMETLVESIPRGVMLRRVAREKIPREHAYLDKNSMTMRLVIDTYPIPEGMILPSKPLIENRYNIGTDSMDLNVTVALACRFDVWVV